MLTLKRPHAIVLATLLTAGSLAAQDRTLTYAQPEDAGMSAAILDGAVGLYRESVARGDLVGAVLMVARDGKIVMHEAVGSRDHDNDLPMERNTLFRMASNTKPVIATAIAQLVDEGKLAYHDLVRAYIPEWDNYRSGFITISHLLSHSSGLRIPTLFLSPLGDNPTLQSEVARFGPIGAEVTPGETYSYNNPGYNTLGALIEIASGQLLEARLTDALYAPLGMTDSYNHRAGHTAGGKLDRMGAVYYRRDANGVWEAGGTPGGPRYFPFARGSGGMISTTGDYAVFLQMILNGGVYDGTRYVSRESWREMFVPRIRSGGTDDDPVHYAYGWSVQGAVASHSGSDGTYAWVDFDRRIIGMVFTQTPRGPNPRTRFRELVNLSINR